MANNALWCRNSIENKTVYCDVCDTVKYWDLTRAQGYFTGPGIVGRVRKYEPVLKPESGSTMASPSCFNMLL